jgi:hypothetical protein
MSHTLRHKLSPLEENLSNFLYVTDLNESVYNSYLSFNDKTFSNNKLDFDLYNQIYEIQKVNSEKKEFLEKAYIETSNITDIKKRKDLLKQELKLENLKTKYFNISLTSLSPISLILILRNHIIELEQKIYELNNSKNNYLLRLNEINLEIDELINKDIEVDIVINKLIDMKLNLESKVIEHQNKLNSIKQQIELDKIIHKENKIKRKVIKDKKNKKKKIDNKKAILKQLMPDLSKINSINKKFVSEENLLLSNKVKLNEITEDIKSNESSRIYNVSNLSNRDKDKKNLDLSLSNTENNIINLNNDLNLSSNTNFSKEILNNINNRGKKKNNKFINNNNIKVRKYSTKSYLEDSNFYLDSPIFFELKRIINNSPRTEETQIIIEKFLMDHANNLLIKKIDQDTEINYNRLNSKVLNFISKQVGEILLMIQNYKNNILYISENQQKELTTSQKVEYKIIVNLDNDKILSFILGRLLRIISYNSFSLKKNNQTQIAKDLGEALL